MAELSEIFQFIETADNATMRPRQRSQTPGAIWRKLQKDSGASTQMNFYVENKSITNGSINCILSEIHSVYNPDLM